jgi:hypothetical protein
MQTRTPTTAVVLLSLALRGASGLAASVEDVNAAIERGRRHLLAHAKSPYGRGELALATLALAKTGTAVEDPRFAELVEDLVQATSGGEYAPAARGGPDNYEAAVVLMALAAVDPKRHRPNIELVARYLMKKQKPDGAWDYDGGVTGDTSMTQYGILGLWEAANAGVAVPKDVWERAARWLASRQDVEGGFVYHPVAPTGPGRMKHSSVLHTMSVAGVGTLLICRSMLKIRPDARLKSSKADDETPSEFDLLTRVEEEAPGKTAESRRADAARASAGLAQQINEAIQLGLDWVHAHFTIDKPSGPHGYYLYGVERLGTLAGAPRLGGVDWYDAGGDYLIRQQDQYGRWKFSYSDVVDTSFALLFLARSTLKSMRYELVFLKEATAVGGRGVPSGDDASDAVERRNPRYQKAATTAVDEILAALEKGGDFLDEGAAAAIETADSKEIVARFAADKRALVRLARHPTPEVREAALWAVAKLKDYRLAPVLIEGLSDPDPNVYRAADGGLRFLSRRVGGVGLPDAPPSKQALARGIAAWRAWCDALNVPLDARQEFDDGL